MRRQAGQIHPKTIIGQIALLICVVIASAIPTSSAPSLTIRFDTVKVSVTAPATQLRLGLANPVDHLAGFELMLVLNRPDLAIFDGNYDTAGSVITGWEYLGVIPEAGGGRLHLVALAEFFPPYTHLPVFPSASDRTLLKVGLDIQPVPDSLTSRTGIVQIDTTIVNFGLASPAGQLIGLVQDTSYDTSFYRCIQFQDTLCILWQQVWSEPIDSVYVDTVIHPYLDPSYFGLPPGIITVLPDCTPITTPGDVNLDGVSSEDDLTALLAFVNFGTPLLNSPHNADLNGDSCIGMTDLLMLEQFLEFGPDSVTIAQCATQHPVRCCCVGTRGNVSNDPADVVDLSDLSHLIAYLTLAVPLSCPKEADWNGNPPINLNDLSSLISYLTGGGANPANCP